MNAEIKKEMMAHLSITGEQTRAVVIVDVTHDGVVGIKAVGNLIDISFCHTNLGMYITESLAGRIQIQEGKNG